MFKKFGTITLFQFNQRKDGFTYAYITYESVLQAQHAIIAMHKMKLQDKVLNVSFATDNCAPKWKKIQDINQQNKVLEPSQSQESS
jgi:RNA recognition motif-containing protein